MMQHKLTGKQPKKINIEHGVFESCGVFYYINVEGMCFIRTKRFMELLPVIVYGRRFPDFANMIHSLRMKMLSGGDDFKRTYFEVTTELTNWDQYLLDNSGQFFDNVIDDTLRFCALFIVTKDEDMTVLNDIHVEEKVNAWKKDMAITDFFLLAKLQVPKYKELVETLWQEKNRKAVEEKMDNLEIPEN